MAIELEQGELIERDRLIRLRDDIAAFVQRECEAQRQRYLRLWSKPTVERVRNGSCIPGLRLERISGRVARFGVHTNESDYREGDRIRLSLGDPNSPIVEGEFFREELTFVDVLLDSDSAYFVPDQSYTLDRSFFDLEHQFVKAMNDLGDTEIGRNRILPLLAGELSPVLDFEGFDAVHEQSSARGVNDAQAEAIAAASTTDLCYLVQGPPGTGKTHVLAEVVRNRVAKGERVLVTSFTHRAIHNALNKIVQVCPPGTDICKVGRKVFDPNLKVDQFEFFAQSPFSDSALGYVVGATPFTAQSRRMNGVEFDTVVFDEAGQITLPLAVMGMLVGRTYIFVGDHKQLPPVLQCRDNQEDTGKSIFSYLGGRGFEDVLNVTYRMNSEITAWPSEQFYLGDLSSHEEVAGRRIHYPARGTGFEEILSPDDPVVLLEIPAGDDTKCSHEEAIQISNLVKELVKNRRLPSGEIGVVVPFRKQARLIKQRLQQAGKPDPVFGDLVIDTVERMQGQERELIIVGLTASDPEFIANLHQFILQPNRLNVCFTRAKSKLVVLASKNLLVSPPEQMESCELKESRELFKSFVSGAKHIVLK